MSASARALRGGGRGGGEKGREREREIEREALHSLSHHSFVLFSLIISCFNREASSASSEALGLREGWAALEEECLVHLEEEWEGLESRYREDLGEETYISSSGGQIFLFR
jgi:hypothetical protein